MISICFICLVCGVLAVRKLIPSPMEAVDYPPPKYLLAGSVLLCNVTKS